MTTALLASGAATPGSDWGDDTYDVVLSVDVFEHVNAPGLAVAQIRRILRSGALSHMYMPFDPPYHPCRIDCWGFSQEAPEYLFGGLGLLDSGFHLIQLRRDIRREVRAQRAVARVEPARRRSAQL